MVCRSNGYVYEWVCKCGATGMSRKSDLSSNSRRACKSCATKLRMKKFMSTDAGKRHQAAMTAAATQRNAKDKTYIALRKRMNCAKDRCTNPTNAAYKNYGGRGIQFKFESGAAAALWVLDNLGTPPHSGLSIDRIDNNGHYEAGNLRWATRAEQAQNKREYKRTPEGESIRRVQAVRPDMCYETIRSYIKKGYTEDDIIKHKKWDGCGSYVRHSKLRPEK